MQRAHRVDYEGAWHHVMNRGARRQTVFHSGDDGRAFLELIGEWSARTAIEVHAFCLMGNHFHLLVRSREGALSDFMQQLSANYTRYLNSRLGFDGALFRGRFHSKLIDSDAYLTTASRYIHRNPVALRPAVPLDRYRWSSYGMYLGTLESIAWLNLQHLIEHHGGRSDMRHHVEGELQIADAHLLDIIAAATAELVGEEVSPVGRLDQMLALLLTDHLPDDAASALIDSLDYTSRASMYTARHRARQRLATDPVIADALRRVCDTISANLTPQLGAAG